MPSTRVRPSVRARFAAAIATVLALVVMGGVTAAPASADVNAYAAVYDRSNGDAALTPANQTITLHHVDGQEYSFQGDFSNGFNTGGIPDGDYYVTVANASYAPSAVVHMDGSATQYQFYVDKFRVTGSVPADAGGVGVQIEQSSGGAWPVVSSTTVSAGFSIALPNGPGQYRLRFQPTVGSGYLETLSSTVIIDGSAPSVSLGAITLRQAPTISGTVVAAEGGAPISGATVHASLGGADVATGTTSGTGTYAITLPGGDADYTVWAQAPGYERLELGQAVAVNATAGYARDGVNFALAEARVDIIGSVGNYYSFDSVKIQLYSGGAAPVLIDETTMGADGAYSFPSIASGDYVIKFLPSGDDAFLPTLLGADNTTVWASTPAVEADFALNNSFTVDADDPATAAGKYVVLEYGALLEGTFSDNSGEPINGCVLVTNVDDPTYSVCADSEAGIWWSLRVPVGGRYTLYASEPTAQYTPEWWSGAKTEDDALTIGPVIDGLQGEYYQFFLDVAPASLEVTATDIAGADPVTAFVYLNEYNEVWRLLGSAEAPAVFTEDYYSGLNEGLVPGDYRIRFQGSDGRWLAATNTVGAPTCFIDVSGITDGSPTVVSANFDSANQTELCGPEVLSYGDVSGHLVSPPTYGSEDVANHNVRIYNERMSLTLTTDADGMFSYRDLPNDSYNIEVLPRVHVAGEHEYTYDATGFDLGDGDIDLGDLVATRYGNVTGQISDWNNATMAGATVTVYYNTTVDGCDCWTPRSLSTQISSTGAFEVPGIDVDGQYAVLVTFDGTYAPTFLGGGVTTPTNPFTGEAEEDYDFGVVTVDAQELVTITGSVLFGSTPVNGVVIAIPEGSPEGFGFIALTDPDGNYELEVAPGFEYKVLAFDGSMDLMAQAYGGFNYDFRNSFDLTTITDYTPLEVGVDDVPEINFALVAYDEVEFDLSLYSWDSENGYDYFAGVTAHLYKKTAGVWAEIATFDSDEEYGEASAEVLGDGDYRLRFSKDGAWLAMHELHSYLEYPYADEVAAELEFDPAQCYYDYVDVKHGSQVYAEITLLTTPVPACDPEAVVVPPVVPGTPVTPVTPVTPGTPAKPGAVKPHRATAAVTTGGEDTALESVDPTATPTPVPSESATETPTDEPSDQPAAAAPAATSSPDLAWLFWTAGVLILVVLVGGGVLMFRRRV